MAQYNRVVIPIIHELVDQMGTELAEGENSLHPGIGFGAINEFAGSTAGQAALMRLSIGIHEAVKEYALSAINFANSQRPADYLGQTNDESPEAAMLPEDDEAQTLCCSCPDMDFCESRGYCQQGKGS